MSTQDALNSMKSIFDTLLPAFLPPIALLASIAWVLHIVARIIGASDRSISSALERDYSAADEMTLTWKEAGYSSEQNDQDVVRCAYCGGKTSTDWYKCQNCGAPL